MMYLIEIEWFLVPMVLVMGVGGCSAEGDGPATIRATEKHWPLAAVVLRARDESGRVGDWITVVDVPSQEIARVTQLPVPTPDGWKHAGGLCFSYNKIKNLIACSAPREYASEYPPWFDEVWAYDVSSGSSRWIAHKRWASVGNFAWSPDGSRLAFMGSTISTRDRVKPRTAHMCIYDTRTGEVNLIADDGVVGYDAARDIPPVWSEDGEFLYYASFSREATRIRLSTLRKEVLPLTASHILTVKGEEIICVQPVDAANEVGGGFRIVKGRPKVGGDTRLALKYLYKGVWFWATAVSPSRRFIFFYDKTDYYSGHYGLTDIQNETTVTRGVGSLLPENVFLFSLSTCVD